jgi:alpha-D-ribose 1-methylphosphonate 5-triphosphate diphosphatase
METIYTNCQVVTRTEIFWGTVVVADGTIREIDDSSYQGRGAVDLEGDLLLPGLIEMHTDNLEKNIQPRPGVIWPSIMAAAIAHDAQVACAGITTVYDAVAVGGLRESSLRSRILNDSVEALCRGQALGLFRADHFLHLRCEVSDAQMEQMLVEHGNRPEVRLISVMDHTPGQRQWTDLSKWRQYHRDKRWTEQEAAAILAERTDMQGRYGEKHRKIAIAIAQMRNIPLASHDDTTVDDVTQAAEEGIGIAEFPTTEIAAEKAREKGLTTIMGAPNAIRGISHSGNVCASVLAEKHLLDGLSSDYVPSSLLYAAFHLADTLRVPLNQTVAMVSAVIADTVGLSDRGELKKGKKADMLQVTLVDKLPVVKKVWKRGVQVS